MNNRLPINIVCIYGYNELVFVLDVTLSEMEVLLQLLPTAPKKKCCFKQGFLKVTAPNVLQNGAWKRETVNFNHVTIPQA